MSQENTKKTDELSRILDVRRRTLELSLDCSCAVTRWNRFFFLLCISRIIITGINSEQTVLSFNKRYPKALINFSFEEKINKYGY